MWYWKQELREKSIKTLKRRFIIHKHESNSKVILKLQLRVRSWWGSLMRSGVWTFPGTGISQDFPNSPTNKSITFREQQGGAKSELLSFCKSSYSTYCNFITIFRGFYKQLRTAKWRHANIKFKQRRRFLLWFMLLKIKLGINKKIGLNMVLLKTIIAQTCRKQPCKMIFFPSTYFSYCKIASSTD